MKIMYELFLIIQLRDIISKKGGQTQEEIIRELEEELAKEGFEPKLSSSTFSRYIKILRDEFDVDIKYDSFNKGYFINSINGEYSGIDRLTESFKLFNALKATRGEKRYIFPEIHQPKGLSLFPKVMRAIEKRESIEFNYGKYSTGQEVKRLVEPYVLKESRTRWYVIGKTPDGAIKTFGLDRISELKYSNEKFVPDTSFSVEQKFEHSFGIYASEEYPIEEIILSFDVEDGGYLKSVPLHHSQEVLVDTSTEFRIKLTMRLTLDFLMEIVSRSWSLKVIAPESLRKRVCEIYEAALERNRVI